MKLGKSAIQRNLFSNFFGIGVQLLNQILLVPLYLYYWNVNLYSDWIIITAISSFFSISDIGLNSVTTNQFAISYTRGEKQLCTSLLTNNYLLIGLVASIAMISCLIYVSCFDIVSNLSLHILSREEASYIFLVLTGMIFIGMASSVSDAIYRANSKTHKGVYLNNTARLCECLIILFSLIVHLPMTIMVTIYLLPKCIILVYKTIDTRKLFAYTFRIEDRNIPLLKKLFIPSLTFMSFPVGNAIVYQGFTLVVNKFFGAEALVLFNTTRTLCNFARQLLATMQQAVWPEYSIAYGKNDTIRMRLLHRKAFGIATIGAILISTFLLIFGKYIYTIWTHGSIPFSFALMLAFLIVLIVENSWTTSSVCLMATNKHSKIGVAYITTAIIAIGVACLLAYFKAALPSIVYCLLLIHLPLSCYAIKEALRMTNDNWAELLSIIHIEKSNE